jgi:hypothetical protein
MLTFHVLSEIGIDNADRKKFALQEEIPSSNTLRALQSSQIVLSDNSFWAANYHDNFYLLGHFDWFHYWINNQVNKLRSDTLDALRLLEVEAWKKVKVWFRTVDFSIGYCPQVKTVITPLIRYPSDLAPGSRKERINKFWLALGTTGLHKYRRRDFLGLEDKLILRESYNLHQIRPLPIALIGRPGLGTIRDCLSSGTVIIPISNLNDIELNQNVETLNRLKLIPEFFSDTNWTHQTENSEFLQQISDYETRIVDYWSKASAVTADVVSEILRGVKF